MGYNFTINTKDKELEILISLSEGNEGALDRCISWITTKEFLKEGNLSRRLNQIIREDSKYFKNRRFEREGDSYIFRAEFLSNNKDRAFRSVLNYVVRQVVSFPR